MVRDRYLCRRCGKPPSVIVGQEGFCQNCGERNPLMRPKAYRVTYRRPLLPLNIGIDLLPYSEIVEASSVEQVVEWAESEHLELLEVIETESIAAES